ncbi:MAG: hypothetical protein BroJett040_09630 [Oligoflexia bacterium]|nr:MAG: hypothetical protein BroJett040_09630 [Oligoflexia bacterium]
MALYLEVIQGDNIGSKYLILNGFRLGRTTGDILIPDKKISSLHAQVEKESTGNLALVDLGSSNGILINGQKVKRVGLIPGVSFQVGRTFLKVIEIDQLSPEGMRLSSRWVDVLAREVPNLLAQNAENPTPVKAFTPAITLSFIEGPQTDKVVYLGFGPRRFGADVLDVELECPESPGLAFEIIPDQDGVRFQSYEKEVVQLNGQPVDSALLVDGDIIGVGLTRIKVRLRND